MWNERHWSRCGRPQIVCVCVCRLLYYEVTGSLVDRCPLELLPLRVYFVDYNKRIRRDLNSFSPAGCRNQRCIVIVLDVTVFSFSHWWSLIQFLTSRHGHTAVTSHQTRFFFFFLRGVPCGDVNKASSYNPNRPLHIHRCFCCCCVFDSRAHQQQSVLFSFFLLLFWINNINFNRWSLDTFGCLSFIVRLWNAMNGDI